MPAGCRGCPPCRDWADHSTGGRPRLASNAEEKAGPKPGKTATRNPEEVGALRCVAGGNHAAARFSALACFRKYSASASIRRMPGSGNWPVANLVSQE